MKKIFTIIFILFISVCEMIPQTVTLNTNKYDGYKANTIKSSYSVSSDSINFISINQIFMYICNNGMGSHNPFSDGSGLYWPGGEDASLTSVFYDGLVWGGKVNGEIRVNGNTYRQGLTRGRILNNGLPDNPLNERYKIWKIRKDWENLPSGAERDQYQFDYENWPGDLGAPYEDINLDGQFTSGVDKPKFYGDETLWFVANDMDTAATINTYGSNPIGLEVQVTIYGYNRTDELGDVVFKKYKLINKGNNDLNEAFLGYFADPDLGFSGDDYVGCDTMLNLGYCYNSDNVDEGYYETPPPAIGYFLLQGPVINSTNNDSAFFNDRWLSGKKNLRMTSFVPNLKNYTWSFDPSVGYEGSIQYYNIMNGLRNYGDPMVDPNTGDTTKYGLAGDPVMSTGWYEGTGWPGGPTPGDRRLFLCSGPFNLVSSDTQEIVIAIIMAKGSDNLNSITELRRKALVVQDFYNSYLLTEVTQEKVQQTKFELCQNYPNPFNPSTTIKYSIPEKSVVQLKLFDVLGKEVATLINKEQAAGTYDCKLSMENYSLSTGVYFYQLRAGSYLSTKKLIMVK